MVRAAERPVKSGPVPPLAHNFEQRRQLLHQRVGVLRRQPPGILQRGVWFGVKRSSRFFRQAGEIAEAWRARGGVWGRMMVAGGVNSG